MKTVKLTAILDYYDGIQTFAARDAIGGHYIATAIDTVGDFDRYLVTGAAPERLEQFCAGQLDLRTLLLESPGGEWYTTIANGTSDDPLILEPHYGPLAETDYLPDDGFLLGDREPDPKEIQRLIALGKPVVVTGRLEIANRIASHWELSTDNGMITGKLAPGVSLDGLPVGKYVRFHCAAVTELDPLWRERQTLYLRAIENA